MTSRDAAHTERGPGGAGRTGEFESVLDDYPVRLDNFEGPLDLLLHLIRTNQIDIYDIPIALITQQYLEYIELMKELNLDTAGEFLLMAATLIRSRRGPWFPGRKRGREIRRKRRIRARRSSGVSSSTRSSRRRRSCCTNGRRCGAPQVGARRRAAGGVSRASRSSGSSRSTCSGCCRRSSRFSRRARVQPGVPLPAAEVSIETRTRQLTEQLATSGGRADSRISSPRTPVASTSSRLFSRCSR